jgi:hypothetical protein
MAQLKDTTVNGSLNVSGDATIKGSNFILDGDFRNRSMNHSFISCMYRTRDKICFIWFQILF